ncbi:hypothetical protein IV38_GL000593 [Lactobacillus selangorensis]|uniref:Cytosolic protein n=1 Tax=Lactobacillus selangorensis TaxID=81857 RepID=A0A0R2FM81_9LACO|nr:YqgQ family protein [Lactobacillus selangorensis]KRN29705.1 hypothetical protein IV38_GL000593 [Lactobacillus selangorensis]KRN33766.1 hypothetical protein IV40_GL000075 [Lactobacillus selangorensis]
MKTLYDVQQLLAKYNIYVHLGKRIWDIELMALELDHIHDAGLIDAKTFSTARIILAHEHHREEKDPLINPTELGETHK